MNRSTPAISIIAIAFLTLSAMSLWAQVDSTEAAQPRRDPSGRLTDGEFRARLVDAVKRDSVLLAQFMDSLQSTPEARMRRALTFDPSIWRPTEADRARRAAEIWAAQGFDKVFQNIPRAQLVSVPLGAIAVALGLAEDVSPRIKYTMIATDSVSVVIYSTSADTVRVIISGLQRPGVYDFNWDLKSDDGSKAPMGHYVAEVLVGRRLVVRKRIEVP